MLGLPLVIVGSRLQSIAAVAIAAAIAIALVPEQPAWAVASVGLTIFAVSRAIMRLELDVDAVSWRTWRGSVEAPRSGLELDMGHRYIRVGTSDRQHIKIEVPVEIRPNVREWVEGSQSGSSGSFSDGPDDGAD